MSFLQLIMPYPFFCEHTFIKNGLALYTNLSIISFVQIFIETEKQSSSLLWVYL